MSESEQTTQLLRALALALGVALALGSLAFWPERARVMPARPTLTPPIAFDALDATKLPKSAPQ